MSFTEHGLPLFVVMLLWFGSTALVLWLDSRPARTFGLSLGLAGMLAIAGALLLAATADHGGILAAYLSFAAALAIWGWHEMSFLTGVVTGPNRAACPPGLAGWRRFRAAAATLIHHEMALAVTTVLLLGLAWGRANPTGAIAFALLFGLRLSAKLNIFLGVPALAEELLPPHLAYLRSYFATARMNPLFPVSLAATIGLTIWFGNAALTSDGGVAVRYSLLFSLAALGVVEHMFLVMPFQDAALWRWAKSGTAATVPAATRVRGRDDGL